MWSFGVNELKQIPDSVFQWFIENVIFYEFNDEDRLMNAVRRGDLEKVKELIPVVDVNLTQHSWNGRSWTPLFVAAAKGHVAVMEALLEAGAIVGARQEGGRQDGIVPMHIAARNNSDSAVVEMLIKHGDDVNVVDVFGQTPLDFALGKGRSSVVKTLLKSGADFKKQELPLLKTAIESGDTDLMELLFINGVDVTVLDPDSCSSVMHLAFASGRVDAIAHLAERGGDINSQCIFDEHTPVYSLVTNSDIPSDIKRQIIEKHLCRIDFDAPHSEGNPMLFYVEQNCPELAKMVERFLAGESLQLQDEVAAAEESGAADDEPPAKRARIDWDFGEYISAGSSEVETTGEGSPDLSIWDID